MISGFLFEPDLGFDFIVALVIPFGRKSVMKLMMKLMVFPRSSIQSINTYRSSENQNPCAQMPTRCSFMIAAILTIILLSKLNRTLTLTLSSLGVILDWHTWYCESSTEEVS